MYLAQSVEVKIYRLFKHLQTDLSASRKTHKSESQNHINKEIKIIEVCFAAHARRLKWQRNWEGFVQIMT